ncbi:MAG TPA: VCBS repeat-containing protein [bacterium]|nr:VCBS repeat-containing protein [bacterium]
MAVMLTVCMSVCLSLSGVAQGETYSIPLTITTDLVFPRVPVDPEIDFGSAIAGAGLDGVLDPNSIQVIDTATGKSMPCAVTEDFSYGDKGRIEWVVTNPTHRGYEIRFRVVSERPFREPASCTPLIGLGDLLRYNAGAPRPIACCYLSGLVDLTGDGKRDLVGCWNYAYRPSWPWDGIICYPRVGDEEDFTFGDLVRIRYVEQADSVEYRHFSGTYMMADFADFNGDHRVDLVYSPRSGDRLFLYLNDGKRDAGGMPVFAAAGTLPRPSDAWGPVRAVDLNGDGAMDFVVCNVQGEGSKRPSEAFYLKNTNPNGWPIEPAEAVDLRVAKAPCFFDVDGDGALDVVGFAPPVQGGLESKSRVVWQRNLGGDPPQFRDPLPIDGIEPVLPASMTAVNSGPRRGLLILCDEFQSVVFFEPVPNNGSGVLFKRSQRCESLSSVISLSDQAWPYVCDWDGDGDQDLLVGGGYGWPRIVINEGTNEKPKYAEAQYILSEGSPIRLLRNDILGEPFHWHNMGYSYPVYVDWDADSLPDLILPNETNRIFWYKNIGVRSSPRFGERRQIVVDGYPDSPEKRKVSAERAIEATYPREEEQPFFWRTGAAFADWNGDGLMDLATLDGYTRRLTLFVQYRDNDETLHLRKERPLKLADGRFIDDTIVERSAHWTESFRPVDWDGDGLLDIVYSCAGTVPEKGSIYLLRNVGTTTKPVFDSPRTMCWYGEPIKVTSHGPHPWAGDLDGDGLPDILTCVEWSVYPFFSHAALEMDRRPEFKIGSVMKVTE